MKAVLTVTCLLLGALGGPLDGEIPEASPKYLDQLLSEKSYDEFSYLMDLGDPKLSHPVKRSSKNDPIIATGLPFGDILIPASYPEEARQGMRFEKFSGSKWPPQVPYDLSCKFDKKARDVIVEAINTWNREVPCLKFTRRLNEASYVLFFPGNGCYSILGRTGKQQPISIGNGCEHHSIILHEMMHAVGFAHHQSRWDRDEYIRMLWHNIPDGWKSQYQKTDPNDFGLQGPYDYYSIMHYGLLAPDSGKPAFEVLDGSVDKWRIGNGDRLTSNDKDAIRELYC